MYVTMLGADHTDSPVLSKLLKSCFKNDYAGHVEFTPAYVTSKIEDERNVVKAAWGGRRQSKILGMYRLADANLECAELRWVCVDRHYRRMGIGERILSDAVVEAQTKGVRKLVAQTRSDNNVMIGMLKGKDFRPEGYFADHYKEGIDIVQWARFFA